MGVALVRRMRRHASMPSIPGSIRSSTMRSGEIRASASIASKPSATRSTTKPAERRYSATTSATVGSSSTTSTRRSMRSSLPRVREASAITSSQYARHRGEAGVAAAVRVP